ncbi:MAG TPA: efflux transporter outer membrane subunit [Caulobacteraceae bacterium]|nr:efflux transporter outer membrane subunit [Caulobacteraceae bacterium]
MAIIRSRHLVVPALAVLAAALSACMVGPNYKRPAVASTPAFKELAGWKTAAPSDALDRGDWWTLFNDPLLNDLEAKVAVSNQNLAAAEAAYRNAHAMVAEQRAALFPTVDLSGSANVSGGGGAGSSTINTGTGGTGTGGTGTGGTGTGGTGTGTTVTRGTVQRYQVSVGATWAPDIWGRVRRAIAGAKANAQATAADVANAKLSAQTELATDYLQLRADDEQIRLLQTTADAYQRALQVAKNRYAQGVAAKSDVLTAETTLLDAQAQTEQTVQARATLEHAIAVLTGQPPAALAIEPRSQFTPSIPGVPVGLPSELLERRPDVAAAERRAKNANEQIGVQVAAYYPTITLTPSLGFASSSLSKLFSSSAFTWTLGGDATQILFDGGARKARVAEARATYDQNVAEYRQTVLTAFQQVEDELAAGKYLEQQQRFRAEASAAADENEKIVLNQYRAGQASATDVVTAENTALSARINLVGVEQSQLTAAVSLIEALGGGWTTAQLPKS